MRMLFICTGNTCRSPMAQALAQIAAQEAGRDDVEVFSAGLAAMGGDKASANAAAVIKEYGGDITGRPARRLTEDAVHRADLVLTMTAAQRDAMGYDYPEYVDKIFSLGEYAGTDEDVWDPFGCGMEIYRRCAEQIKKLVQLIIEK